MTSPFLTHLRHTRLKKDGGLAEPVIGPGHIGPDRSPNPDYNTRRQDRIARSLTRASFTDPLTGVAKRRGFFKRGERLRASRRRRNADDVGRIVSAVVRVLIGAIGVPG